MNYNAFLNWIKTKIISMNRLTSVASIYLIFIMAPTRKHTLEAAARFSNSTKSNFHSFLKNHKDIAIYTLSDLSKKQARQFSKINKGLSSAKLPWNIAISVDATILNRSSLHTQNSKRFNHGKGFVVGHQWTNFVLHINDKVIPLLPIPFYTRKYCKQNGIEYQTENTRVAKYLSQLSLEEYIGPHAPEKVVVLADSGYDDHKIQKAIAGKNWKFIIALKSMAKKQLMINKIIENKGLFAVNQLLTQVKGPQRLKAFIQKSLNGSSSSKTPVLCGLTGF